MMRRLADRLCRARRRVRAAGPGREGFSLVEIMIVMTVLAVGIIPIAVVQHHARREVVDADRRTDAIALAQAQLERLKALGYGKIIAQNGVEGTFTWQAQVVNVAYWLDRIDVTVTWDTAKGPMTLTVSDLVSRRN